MAKTEKEAKFDAGVAQFNAGRFFEAHETWEEIWLQSPEPEKTLLQGIIQIAAAFHHYTRGNPQGAGSLLAAGLKRLAPFPSTQHGIALDPLRAAAGRWVAALAEGQNPGPEHVPKIKLAHHD